MTARREFRRVLAEEVDGLGDEWRVVAMEQLENGLTVALVERHASEAAGTPEETKAA